MKILICTPEYPPYASGMGNVIYNITNCFKDLDVDVKVCSPVGPDIKIGDHRLMKFTGILGLIYFWNNVSKYLKNNNFDLIWINGDVFLFKKQFKYALITLHSTYLGFYTKRVSPSLYYKVSSLIEKFFLKKINDKCVSFSGVSQEVCAEMENIGINKRKINYIPNGVDTNKFKPSKNKNDLRDKFGLPKDHIIILSVGRLIALKRPQKLINTFALIEKKIPKSTLLIVGSGDLLNKTKELVNQKNLKEKVKFLGKLDYKKDIPDIYSIADYYIMTSIYEGQPLTLLEAMASGLPCIVSDLTTLQIVKKAKCGITVNFDNIENSIEEIIEYIKSDNIIDSENARNYAIKNLKWSTIAEQYIKEFKKIIQC